MNQDEYSASQALLDVLKVIYKIKPSTEDGIDVLLEVENAVEHMLKKEFQKLQRPEKKYVGGIQ